MLGSQVSKTIVSPAVLERLGIHIPEHARRWTVTLSGRQPISMPLARVSSLAVGALVVEELDVGVQDAFPPASGVEGVLGGDVLDWTISA